MCRYFVIFVKIHTFSQNNVVTVVFYKWFLKYFMRLIKRNHQSTDTKLFIDQLTSKPLISCTANVCRQTTDKLIFKSVISTQRYLHFYRHLSVVLG